MLEFYVEYLNGDDDGIYIGSAKFKSESIEKALKYADDKYGDVILIRRTDYCN